MPTYTIDLNPLITLPNNIREGQPNPFFERHVDSLDKRIEVEKSLDIPNTLPDGKNQNYKEQYYKDIFSANTTAGYTEMKQTTFATKFGVIYGYQTKK